MNFIEYLTSLPQDGETMLFTRQTPKANGKGHTYPAFLPADMQGEGSWYGNTGLYIIDRLKPERPSASASNIEYVAVMILDDIGTKSKTPDLPPTWIMETSPDNYQWGYTFSEQPAKADYCAAITAIAAAGYSDPGATNAVRNFRIPGSINIKEGRENFAARLVEFHPNREYTIEEICKALDVTPGEAKKGMQPIHLADNGNDDVLAWLNTKSLVLEKANVEGWAGVVCPNHANHTDGKPMGRYQPATRSYMCFHGHCQHVTSDLFLQWVAENGGPKHEHGVRDDLLAEVMSEVQKKLLPQKADSVFSPGTDAVEIVAKTEAKDEARRKDRHERDALHDQYAYVSSDDSYFDLETRGELTRRAFDAQFRHLDTRSGFGKFPRVTASVWFDENRQPKNGLLLSGITYAPGQGAMCAKGNDVYGNKWVDGRPKGKKGDVKRFLALLARVVPNVEEQEHILNVFAYKRQNPGVKINHAILLIGRPGIGKDSIYAPLLYAVGGSANANVHIIKEGVELIDNFGYALENEVIVLNELRQPETRDRRAMENSLKPIIAAPPEYLSVNRKNKHPYDALNRILVLAGSNHDVPIALPSDDRRWFVVKSQAEPLTPAEGKTIWDWYKSGGLDAISGWLDTRDVSAFNPGAAPPMTEAKALMIEQGHSEVEAFLLDAIRNRTGVFAKGAIAGPWHVVVEAVQAGAPDRLRIYSGAVFHALKEAGWRDLGKLHAAGYPTKKHIFAAPDILATKTKSEIRRLIEEPATIGIVKQ